MTASFRSYSHVWSSSVFACFQSMLSSGDRAVFTIIGTIPWSTTWLLRSARCPDQVLTFSVQPVGVRRLLFRTPRTHVHAWTRVLCALLLISVALKVWVPLCVVFSRFVAVCLLPGRWPLVHGLASWKHFVGDVCVSIWGAPLWFYLRLWYSMVLS